LEVSLVGVRDGEPAHEAEIGIRVDDHPELSDVELERLVLVQNVDEGARSPLEHEGADAARRSTSLKES
jgi:hypothetical protein